MSSFNQFIHELSVDSDTSSPEYSSEEEDSDRYECPPSPAASHSSRASEAYSRRQMDWFQYILLWILFPVKLLLVIPLHLFQLVYYWVSKALSIPGNQRPSRLHPHKRMQSLKDQIIHRTTDRRRGVVEVVLLSLYINLYCLYLYF